MAAQTPAGVSVVDTTSTRNGRTRTPPAPSTSLSSPRSPRLSSSSPRNAVEPDFHKPPERVKEKIFVRLNRFFARLWLFTIAAVFDLVTWPFKRLAPAVLPEALMFHFYAWWISMSTGFIWTITICEKLVMKLRAPRRDDVTRCVRSAAHSRVGRSAVCSFLRFGKPLSVFAALE